MPFEQWINVEEGLVRVGGKTDLYRRLLGKFEESVKMAELTSLLEAGDFEKAGILVHGAKGVAGNLSLTAFFQASSVLMKQLRDGGRPEDEELRRFCDAFEGTKQAIADYLAG